MRIQGVLFDFDGTISKNALSIILDFLKDYINQYINIPASFLKDYLKCITTLNIGEATHLLFQSLGLSEYTKDFLSQLNDLSEHAGRSIVIESDFISFLEYCESQGIASRVFSAAGSSASRFEPLHPYMKQEHFFSIADSEKANPNTYVELSAKYTIIPQEWLYIDDSPLALWNAKSAGFQTAMMFNDIFTPHDYSLYQEHIDFSLPDFTTLQDQIAYHGLSQN